MQGQSRCPERDDGSVEDLDRLVYYLSVHLVFSELLHSEIRNYGTVVTMFVLFKLAEEFQFSFFNLNKKSEASWPVFLGQSVGRQYNHETSASRMQIFLGIDFCNGNLKIRELIDLCIQDTEWSESYR